LSKSEIYESLSKAIIDGDIELAKKAAEDAVNAGITPTDAIENGLMKGMKIIGEKFSRLEMFLPNVLVAADAMEAAIAVLKPRMMPEELSKIKIGKVVIGTIQGDIHDIGKSIVSIMLSASGFEVFDLGKDVPLFNFVKKADEINADIIAVSALMTTTMEYMRDLILLMKETGVRQKYKVMVGGAPVLPEWAEEIGADGYGKDASEAVGVAKRLLRHKSCGRSHD